MDKFAELLAKCECEVQLTVNGYKSSYLNIEEGLEEVTESCPSEVTDEVKEGILRTGRIIELQFYPRTPVGFHIIVDYDLERALTRALECVA